MKKNTYVLFLIFTIITKISLAQTSNLVSIDSDGVLTYAPDANGNIIPDFSNVGYHQGELEIPDVPIVMTLNPTNGDRHQDIQSAIDQIGVMNLDANGHRGTLLLTAGLYEVSQTVSINKSGIVIRGEGNDQNGTIVRITATVQDDLFFFTGNGIQKDQNTTKQITDSYVPIGAKTVTVESGHTFQEGERVVLTHIPNNDWLSFLGMDDLDMTCTNTVANWTPTNSTVEYKRKVVSVSVNQITLDAPIVDPIDSAYSTASLKKFTWASVVDECGIENIRLESTYMSDTDNDHGFRAVRMRNMVNSWVRDVKAYYFAFGCVDVRTGSYQITVENCGMYDYKSVVTGGYRYGFNSVLSDLVLFKDCESDGARHDFAQGQFTPGPTVYLRCLATNSTNDIGGHQRWATGTLYDNVSTNKEINARNRVCSGNGHGWAGAQQVFWNSTAGKIILHDPPSNPTNWAIGCTTTQGITNVSWGGYTEPLGIVESENMPILDIPSLYEAQLFDRLNNSVLSTDDFDNSNVIYSVYPNPSSNKISIRNLTLGENIKIYSFTGQLIENKNYTGSIDGSALNEGVYFIVFNTDKGLHTLKWIKNNL